MNQPFPWLIASLLLVSGVVYFAARAYRVLQRRVDAAQHQSRELAGLHLATMEALALAIDAKDQTARNHIRRVEIYCTGLARALGMSDLDIEAVRTAALLHDIGK